MEYLRSDPEKMVCKIVSKFVDEELSSLKSQKIDNLGNFPKEIFKKIADMGIFKIRYLDSKKYNFRKTTLYCKICEELARGLMSVASIVAMQCLMSTNFLFYNGNEEMIENYFLPAMKGEKIGSFCLTEPESGSDLGSISTIAKKIENGYIINGLKTWVTNGPIADFYTVLCKDKPISDMKGLCFCFIPKKFKGVSISNSFKTVGTQTTPICEVFFKDVYIPNHYCLIPPGQGIGSLLSILSEIRVMTSSLAIGLQRSVIYDSIKYAKERVAWGKSISNYQLIKSKIAKMSVNLEASKLLTYKAANMIDLGKNTLKEATIAKYFSSESACEAADECTRIFGAYGYSLDYAAQRYYRDTRFLLNGGGTHEVLLTNIAKFEGL